jgi:hypothetical protein
MSAPYAYPTVKKFYYFEAVSVNICDAVFVPYDVVGIKNVFQTIFTQ